MSESEFSEDEVRELLESVLSGQLNCGVPESAMSPEEERKLCRAVERQAYGAGARYPALSKVMQYEPVAFKTFMSFPGMWDIWEKHRKGHRQVLNSEIVRVHHPGIWTVTRPA